MHVLVTGGLGFVGSAVTHVLLEAGHTVTVLSHSATDPARSVPGAQLVRADLRDRESLRSGLSGSQIEGVCHLAGLARVRDSFERPLDYFEVNTSGTANLLRAVRRDHRQPGAVRLRIDGSRVRQPCRRQAY